MWPPQILFNTSKHLKMTLQRASHVNKNSVGPRLLDPTLTPTHLELKYHQLPRRAAWGALFLLDTISSTGWWLPRFGFGYLKSPCTYGVNLCWIYTISNMGPQFASMQPSPSFSIAFYYVQYNIEEGGVGPHCPCCWLLCCSLFCLIWWWARDSWGPLIFKWPYLCNGSTKKGPSWIKMTSSPWPSLAATLLIEPNSDTNYWAKNETHSHNKLYVVHL